MENEAFKEMIEKDCIRQSFVRINPDTDKESLSRFFQHTIIPVKLYINTWSINPETNMLEKEFKLITPGNWRYHWGKYMNYVTDSNNDDLEHKIKWCQQMSKEAPVQQREYWKMKEDSIRFILADMRVSRRNQNE